MFIVTILSLLAASLPVLGQCPDNGLDGQPIQYVAGHNLTVITGTWSTGSQQVVTGSGFANPANESFNYPRNTGESFSFSDDGFYEIARYRFNSNGSEPTCITGVIGWVHGTYQLLTNGSIVMTPLGDGYQQIQDPCAAQSNFVENYNDTELYCSWQIFQDPVAGYKLHLFQFDGSPVAPQFLVSSTPNMLPTTLLRNVTTAITTTNGFTSTGDNTGQSDEVLASTNAGVRRWGDAIGAGVATSLLVAGLAALLL